MKVNVLLGILSLGILISFSSCSNSNDDDHRDPTGTITLNMMNEDHGKTILGDSDVYIDKANNFYGPTCIISQLGDRGGLGGKLDPKLDALAEKVAVVPGTVYQVFRKLALLEFPSGKPAVSIEADYYNVYVQSNITQEGTTVGATLKYVLAEVPTYGLPSFDHKIGTFERVGEEITLELPVSDFEYYVDEGYNTFEIEKNGKLLKIRLTEHNYRDNFGIYIRVEGSYTYVYGTIE